MSCAPLVGTSANMLQCPALRRGSHVLAVLTVLAATVSIRHVRALQYMIDVFSLCSDSACQADRQACPDKS